MKMYCIFARESIDKMGGNRGKLAAQAGHAFLGALMDGRMFGSESALAYRVGDAKIALVTGTVEDLRQLQKSYWGVVGTSLITDAAHTVFSEPTVTCLGLGPISDEDVGDDIKQLKVLL